MLESATFSSETIAWLIGIAEHNHKEWFATHKHEYEAHVKLPFTTLLERAAEAFGGGPHIFRPYRDVRFSKDKTLYKTNISGYLRGSSGGARYVELSLGGLFAATGYYEMSSDQLNRYRQVLIGSLAEALGEGLRSAVSRTEGKGYVVGGERLKTLPRGIAKEAPNNDLLKFKSITVSKTLPIENAYDSANAFKFIAETWRAGDEINFWMDTHVGQSTQLDWR